jgi:cell division inhibitor SepF
MSMFSRIGSWFAIRDEEEEDVFEHQPDGKPRNVVPLTDAGRRLGASVAVFAPRSFGEVTEVADALRGRQVAILNLQGADRALLQRVVDFTSGVAYTLDGRIQKLAESIYLVVPAGIVVNSQHVREQVDQDGMLDLTARFGSQNRP